MNRSLPWMSGAAIALSTLLYASAVFPTAVDGFWHDRPISLTESVNDGRTRERFLSISSEDAWDRYRVLFFYFLTGFIEHRSQYGAPVHYSGFPSSGGHLLSGLEGFARTAPLFASWISAGNPTVLQDAALGTDIDLVEILRTGIVTGSDPASPEFWGRMKDNDQRIVEAADIAITLWLTRFEIWDKLDASQKANVSNWLKQVNDVRIDNRNNWILRTVVVNAFLDSVGFKVADGYSNLYEFKSNYLESGWFRDGPTGEVDYYNTWSIPYDLFWISEMSPSIDRAFIDDVISKSSYLTKHLLSPAGLAMMGRSICYRTSVPSPVSINALRKKSVEHEREARRALDVTWNYFISNKILRDGTITMGYTDNDPRLVDNYSGPGSCHWGLRSLTLAYMNRPTASFWTNGSSPLPVEISDYHIDLDAIGWKVDGVKSSGEIRITLRDNIGNASRDLESFGVWGRAIEYIFQRPRRPQNYYSKYKLPTYTNKSQVLEAN